MLLYMVSRTILKVLLIEFKDLNYCLVHGLEQGDSVWWQKYYILILWSDFSDFQFTKSTL